MNMVILPGFSKYLQKCVNLDCVEARIVLQQRVGNRVSIDNLTSIDDKREVLTALQALREDYLGAIRSGDEGDDDGVSEYRLRRKHVDDDYSPS